MGFVFRVAMRRKVAGTQGGLSEHCPLTSATWTGLSLGRRLEGHKVDASIETPVLAKIHYPCLEPA